MFYILLAFIFYAILFNTLSITLLIALKRPQRPDRGQNATHCRACNVLLIEHNHGCQWDDLKQVPIAQINIREDFSMLKEYVTTDTSTLSEVEQRLLLDYFRYKEVVSELKSNYPELAKQYGILDEPKKRKVKVASEPIETVQETIEDWLQDSFPGLKSGRNKLGGGTCRLSASKITAKMVERMDAEYTAIYGITEREILVSKCPKCNGHFRTSFERTDEFEVDEEDYQRKIRKQVTRFTCDDCGHTLIGSCGDYLVNKEYDAVANANGRPQIVTEPALSISRINENNADDLTEAQIDELEHEPISELCYCDKCEQNFEDSEMDNGNCPFCGSRIVDEPIEAELAYSNIM
jgi:hypothetical protein